MKDCSHTHQSSCLADSLASAAAVAVRRATAVGGCLSRSGECVSKDPAQRSPSDCYCSTCGSCNQNILLPTTAELNKLCGSDIPCDGCERLHGVGERDAPFVELTARLLACAAEREQRLCQSACCHCPVCGDDRVCGSGNGLTYEAVSSACLEQCSHIKKPFLPPASLVPPVIELESSGATDAAEGTVEQCLGEGGADSPDRSCHPPSGVRKDPGSAGAAASSATTATNAPLPKGRRISSGPVPVTSDSSWSREGTLESRSCESRSLLRSSSLNPLFTSAAASSSSRAGGGNRVAPSASQLAGPSTTSTENERNAEASFLLKQVADTLSSAAAPGETNGSFPTKEASDDPTAAMTDAVFTLAQRKITPAEKFLAETDVKASTGHGANQAAAVAGKEAPRKLSFTEAVHSGNAPSHHCPGQMCSQRLASSGQDSMRKHTETPPTGGVSPELDMLQQAEAEALVAAAAPRANFTAFFRTLEEVGIVLVRKTDVHCWTKQLAQQRHQIMVTQAQLKVKSAEAAEAQRKLQSQAKTAQDATTRLLSSLKATKLLEQTLATATADLETEKETIKRLQRDKKDLCRTIERLKDKLSRTENEFSILQKQSEALQQDRRKAESRNTAYRKNLKGLGDVQNSLTEELAAERLEKRELRKLFEEKLVHIQQQQDNWQEQKNRQDYLVQRWKEMLARERAERQGAEMQQQRLTEQLEEMQALASDLAMQKEDLGLQLRQQTEVNKKLQKDFEAVNGRLQRVERRRRENQLDWMRDHLKKVDHFRAAGQCERCYRRRREYRHSAIQQCDAMAQADIDPVFRESFPPMDITATHSLKRPFDNTHPSLLYPGAWVRPEEVTY